MKGFDVLHVKSAVKDHNKFDLSRTHLTTMNFGEIVPLMAEETIPGDKFAVKADYFSRMAPLVVPTYGKFQFKTVAGYVPYHMIANDADAWFAGKSSWQGITPHNRWISVITLMRYIRSYCTVATTGDTPDFVYIDEEGRTKKEVFNVKGKYFVKILNALGYSISSGMDFRTTSAWFTNEGSRKLSAYPLIAFFKLYNDYMSQSQRFNTSQLSNLLNAIKYGRQIDNTYIASTGQLDAFALPIMFDSLFLNYENDYFTSAWQSPNAPIGQTETVSGLDVPGNGATSTFVNRIDNTATDVVLAGLSGTRNRISQRALDFLKSFDDWVRRNNYSGSRAVQQVYSRFGIKTSDYRDHYANVITTDSMPIQVGDVTSTSDYGDKLGDYAGKGIMSGSKGFSMQADDYGIIIVLGYFTVTPMNPYGFDRKVLRTDPLDYYNPEFDGLGADAISVGEYFTDPITSGQTVLDSAVYGYTERYNAYRYGRDQITGEFRKLNTNDMNAWHTGRDMTAIRKGNQLVAQSTSVNTMPQTGSEYNRIFSVPAADVDKFYLTAHFDVSAIRPILNLNQVPRLGEGDTVVPRNGNTIS